MEIGKNLKDAGIKFISSVDLQTGQVEFDKNGESKIVTPQNQTEGFGEATSETQKKLDETIVYKNKEGSDV